MYQWKSFLSNTLLDLLTNEKPDERQIMTYVSCYYHAFQGAMQVQRWACHQLTCLSETEGHGVCVSLVFPLLCFSPSACFPKTA